MEPSLPLGAPHCEPLDSIRDSLLRRVQDWKRLDPRQFGRLGAYGHFSLLLPVHNGQQRMHHRSHDVYLFEHILIAAKQATEKQPTSWVGPAFGDYRLRTTIKLKGRIFLSSITRTDFVGDSKLRIHWSTVPVTRLGKMSRIPDPSWETFTIYFERPEVCRRWIDLLVRYRMAVAGINMAMAMPAKAEDHENEGKKEGREVDGREKRGRSVLVIRAF